MRAFGEERARVNLELTPKARLEYLAWMRSGARRAGVPCPPNYSVARMVKLEEELDRELGD